MHRDLTFPPRLPAARDPARLCLALLRSSTSLRMTRAEARIASSEVCPKGQVKFLRSEVILRIVKFCSITRKVSLKRCHPERSASGVEPVRAMLCIGISPLDQSANRGRFHYSVFRRAEMPVDMLPKQLDIWSRSNHSIYFSQSSKFDMLPKGNERGYAPCRTFSCFSRVAYRATHILLCEHATTLRHCVLCSVKTERSRSNLRIRPCEQAPRYGFA